MLVVEFFLGIPALGFLAWPYPDERPPGWSERSLDDMLCGGLTARWLTSAKRLKSVLQSFAGSIGRPETLELTWPHWLESLKMVASMGKSAMSASRALVFGARCKDFYMQAADVIEAGHPVAGEKLRRATPHWMQYSHANHAVARTAELTAVLDNLRHALIATTSMYLRDDELLHLARATGFWGSLRQAKSRLNFHHAGGRNFLGFPLRTPGTKTLATTALPSTS